MSADTDPTGSNSKISELIHGRSWQEMPVGTGLAFMHADVDIKAPVYVSDTIAVIVEVTGSRAASTGDRGIVTTTNTVFNQRGDEVMVYAPVRLTKGDAGAR
jgi:acyl dehydratase